MNEYERLKSRGFKDYSEGHQKMYLGPIEIISGLSLPPIHILDVGCGIGFGAKQIIRKCNLKGYIGIDSCAECITHCKAHIHNPRASFVESDWLSFNPPFKSDFTFCIEVVEHLTEGQVEPFLRKLREHTARNLFLSTPDKTTSKHGTRTTEEWRQALKRCGFDVVCLTRQRPILFICEPCQSS